MQSVIDYLRFTGCLYQRFTGDWCVEIYRNDCLFAYYQDLPDRCSAQLMLDQCLSGLYV